jgi:hypothetical protein
MGNTAASQRSSSYFAQIQLENCIDLFDVGWQPALKNMYSLFIERHRMLNQPLPKQSSHSSKANRLDCAFLNFVHEFMLKQGQSIDSIRATFIEGERLFPNSAIFDLAHVQIAIRRMLLDVSQRSHYDDRYSQNHRAIRKLFCQCNK